MYKLWGIKVRHLNYKLLSVNTLSLFDGDKEVAVHPVCSANGGTWDSAQHLPLMSK